MLVSREKILWIYTDFCLQDLFFLIFTIQKAPTTSEYTYGEEFWIELLAECCVIMVDSRMRCSRIIRTYFEHKRSRNKSLNHMSYAQGCHYFTKPARAIRKRMSMQLKSLTCCQEIYDFNSTRNASDSFFFSLQATSKDGNLHFVFASMKAPYDPQVGVSMRMAGIRFNLVGLAQT